MATNKVLFEFMQQRIKGEGTYWAYRDKQADNYYVKHNGHKEDELIKRLNDVQLEYLVFDGENPKMSEEGQHVFNEGKTLEEYEKVIEEIWNEPVDIRFTWGVI